MFTKKIIIFTAILSVLALFVGMAAGFYVFRSFPDMGTSDLSKLIQNRSESIDIAQEAAQKPEEVEPVSTVEKITPSTKIVYQYYYEGDDVMEEQEDVPTYFLLDLTLDDMLKYYTNWQIVSFSSEKVVMRKNIKGNSRQRYIIGEKDGYVAVFYEQEQNGETLHDVTDTPVSSLPEDEVERLKEGISVVGDDNLAKALADYES